MIWSCTSLVRPQQETLLLHEVILKLAALIRMDDRRHAKITDDQLEKRVCEGKGQALVHREKQSMITRTSHWWPHPGGLRPSRFYRTTPETNLYVLNHPLPTRRKVVPPDPR